VVDFTTPLPMPFPTEGDPGCLTIPFETPLFTDGELPGFTIPFAMPLSTEGGAVPAGDCPAVVGALLTAWAETCDAKMNGAAPRAKSRDLGMCGAFYEG
jgi:hypothetical protein